MNDGDQVPADIRVLFANDLKVDNSCLTGESEPVERYPELARDSNGKLITVPLEAANLCFFTTIVTSGSGRGMVIGTGDRCSEALEVVGLGLSTLVRKGSTQSHCTGTFHPVTHRHAPCCRTVMGQIAGLAAESSGESQTQFQREVATFIKIISVLAITIGAPHCAVALLLSLES